MKPQSVLRLIRDIGFCICLPLGPLVFAQQPGDNSLHSLDAEYLTALDASTTKAFVAHAGNITFVSVLPPSIVDRLVKAHLQFRDKGTGLVTEHQIVSAVNELIAGLGISFTSKTSILQVHSLRVALFKDIPHLLRSPQGLTPPNKLFGPELSPAGALLMTLIIVNQKLTNPKWFGDPDLSTTAWLSEPQQKSTSTQYSLKPPPGTTNPLLPTEANVAISKFLIQAEDPTSGIVVLLNSSLDTLGLSR